MTTDPVELFAPTGAGIQGTYEKVSGAAGVDFFSMQDAKGKYSFEHDGNGTEMFWDDSDTQTIDGETLFTDTDGQDWLHHHLIPAIDGVLKPLSEPTLAMIREELIVGEALEASRDLARAMACIPFGYRARARIDHKQIVCELEEAYAGAKAASIAAIQKELSER